MSNEVVLYDLPCRGECQCWSPNPWKSRAVLNFKGIPYKTEFVPFHKLQETLRATGMKPHDPVQWTEYSIPTIRLPDGTYIQESTAIAQALEKLHPSPSLHLDTDMHSTVQAALGKVASPLLPVFMPLIGRNIVVPSDVEWFEADRSRRFGMSMAEWERTAGGEKAWEACRPGMEELREVLKGNKRDEGPFVLGSVVSYGDLCVLGMVRFMRILGLWERFRREFGGAELDELWEAGKQWVERAD